VLVFKPGSSVFRGSIIVYLRLKDLANKREDRATRQSNVTYVRYVTVLKINFRFRLFRFKVGRLKEGGNFSTTLSAGIIKGRSLVSTGTFHIEFPANNMMAVSVRIGPS
jgi:hypothetical protein